MLQSRNETLVRVGLASCGIAAGAMPVWERLKEILEPQGIEVMRTGCIGLCFAEPLVEVVTEGKSYLYGYIDPDKAEQIVSSHILQGNPLHDLLVYADGEKIPEGEFLTRQVRIVLRNCGRIDPDSIDSYREAGGYSALAKALGEMTPEQVIEEIKTSGLRGRGGAGFPTHIKWTATRNASGYPKYIVCNADEGDPGAFMDRSVLESDPHSVLEGMALAGYAIGANYGFIYVRAEYPLAVERLKKAIAQGEEQGVLGGNIMGSGFDFFLEIREGAGAFVCGEETALLQSIEGKRGMPRFRPPFPAEKGLWGQPTSINNVESFANVAWIIANGGSAFASYGSEGSKGTKVFALAGKVKRGGLVEVPMGITLREIVEDIGGGIRAGGELKAVQTGGPSGGCIPASLVDTPVDYDSLKKIGAIMGSGGMLVMDKSTCMVDVARFFLNFTQNESCGKCTFCRVGTRRMLEILERITAGEGREEDLELLNELAVKVKTASLCGLGQTAPNPVLTTLNYFRDEYLAHVRDHNCPAGQCKALISYRVIEDKCVGCGLCSKQCSAGAISGPNKGPHQIDEEKCTRCGLCHAVCRHGAIEIVARRAAVAG